jgi:hypothetical protein
MASGSSRSRGGVYADGADVSASSRGPALGGVRKSNIRLIVYITISCNPNYT